MSDETPPDIDLGTPHLRPAQREAPRAAAQAGDAGAGRIPWEGSREGGLAAAYLATCRRVAAAPLAVWTAVPPAGGVRRPVTFALLCGAVFGGISELIDSLTVALIRCGGSGADLSEVFQLDIAGRSLDWLPISVLSAAGCLFALLVGLPVYLLAYGLLVLLWTAILHLMLGISGALAASRAGWEGTLRAVCYSQVALAVAMVPWIGDPIAVLGSFALQVPGLARMHGCGRGRAALAVAVPTALLLLAVAALLLAAGADVAAG